MKIWNCSKKFVQTNLAELLQDESLCALSFNDFQSTPLDFGDAPNKALVLFFDDASPADLVPNPDVKLFDEAIANQILDFAEDAFKHCKNLWVHCGAGRSRSAAVSIALNDYINKILSENATDREHNRLHGFEFPPMPNPYISAIMNKAISDRIV